MAIKERLMKFIESNGFSVRQFEKTIGVSNGYVKGVGGQIGTRICNRIFTAYPELNRVWLLTGEGDMLNPSPVQPTHVYNASVGDGARGNMVVGAGTTFTQTGGMASDVTACLEIIKGMQEQILTLQRQLEESHCKVADLMMQALAKRE